MFSLRCVAVRRHCADGACACARAYKAYVYAQLWRSRSDGGGGRSPRVGSPEILLRLRRSEQHRERTCHDRNMTGTLSGGGRGSVLVSCGGVLRARYRRNNIMSVSRPPAIKTPSRVDGAVFRRVGEGGVTCVGNIL